MMRTCIGSSTEMEIVLRRLVLMRGRLGTLHAAGPCAPWHTGRSTIFRFEVRMRRGGSHQLSVRWRCCRVALLEGSTPIVSIALCLVLIAGGEGGSA